MLCLFKNFDTDPQHISPYQESEVYTPQFQLLLLTCRFVHQETMYKIEKKDRKTRGIKDKMSYKILRSGLRENIFQTKKNNSLIE